ncbi:hypothetical protein FXO38_29793 [Capsicum annuum]|nr:hypothetical protein FXO38_29793 [Capsicum annuum]KAF3670053.1 hypothetical protein FXO37_08713 [Capsicum annuum]
MRFSYLFSGVKACFECYPQEPVMILDMVMNSLTTEELETLAHLGSKARKTASRDIAIVMAGRENGATTVSATMYLASKVGIPVFVIGGIGGVHRHGENTMDISSDLTEHGNTPVAVILLVLNRY